MRAAPPTPLDTSGIVEDVADEAVEKARVNNRIGARDDKLRTSPGFVVQKIGLMTNLVCDTCNRN